MEQMIIKVKINQFPAEPIPEVGMDLELSGQDGSIIPATITHIEGEDVTIDANHPLAGKTLVFDLSLVEIL
jgi:peptidylprolyl isomerase